MTKKSTGNFDITHSDIDQDQLKDLMNMSMRNKDLYHNTRTA